MTDDASAAADSLGQRVARPEAIQELKSLKARYFASVDGRDWKSFRAVFTDDCTFTSSANLPQLHGPDDFVQYIRLVVEPGNSLHLGFVPHLEIAGPTVAYGTWSMYDYVVSGAGRSGRQGFGTYREEYRLGLPGWQICSWHLEWLWTERLSPQ